MKSFLESGPPINSPWNNSQFLSHSLIILEKMAHTSLIAQYMNATPTLGDLATSVAKGSGYTFFAPSDEAFTAMCSQGSPSCGSSLQVVVFWSICLVLTFNFLAGWTEDGSTG